MNRCQMDRAGRRGLAALDAIEATSFQPICEDGAPATQPVMAGLVRLVPAIHVFLDTK
jgi:hypothetical protein